MSWSLTVTTPPAFEAMTIAELKALLHFDGTDEDAVLLMTLGIAREFFEADINRSVVTQTLTYTADAFPSSSVCPILLPRPPLQSITHVKYYDADGVQQTWTASNYAFDTVRYPARLRPAYNINWPTTRDQMNAIEVRYVAGFSSPALVPARYRHAIALLAGHMLENREAGAPIKIEEVPLAYQHLTTSLRNWDFG